MIDNNFMSKQQSKVKTGSGAKLELKKKKDKEQNKSIDTTEIKVGGQEESSVKQSSKGKKGKEDKKEKQKKEKEKKKGKEKENKKDDKKDKKDKKNNKNKDEVKQEWVQEQQQNSDKNRMSSKLLGKQDPQDSTIKNINKSSDKVKESISQLIEQYKGVAQRVLLNNHGSDPEREMIIQRQLTKLQKQKEQRHKKLESLSKHKQEIYESRLKQKEAKKQLRRQKLRQKKIDKIQQNLKNLQQNAGKRKQEYQKFKEYVKQRKKFVPRYKKYDQQYKQLLKVDEQNMQDVMQYFKKKHQPMNHEELGQFQLHYMKDKGQGQAYRINKVKLQSQMLKEESKKLEVKLWKGKCHQEVKKQLVAKKQKKLESKSKEDARKQFGENINDNLHKEMKGVKAEQNQPEQDSLHDKKQNTLVRQKFLHGVSFGLVNQDKKIPLSTQDKLKLGNSYLQQIRFLKHRKNKTVDYNLSGQKSILQSHQLRQRSKTYKLKRKSNPYYIQNMNHMKMNLNNFQSIDFAMEKIGAVSEEKKLQDQLVKHGEYGSILQLQESKRRVGNLMIRQINDKLSVLEKL